MELKKISVAVAGILCSASVFAINPPVPQLVEKNHAHSHELAHGVETRQSAYTPTKRTIQQPHPTIKNQMLASVMAEPAATSCNIEAFATSNSNTLISQITQQGTECVNDLFSAEKNIQETAFESNNMYYVAKHAVQLAQSYSGNGDDNLEAIFLYLRAGYYAAFYNNNIQFASWVDSAVKEAVDAFVNNSNFYANNDAHGKVLGEVITTMDSAGLQHHYINVVTTWLNRWDNSYAQHWNMRSAVNGVFTILFGGQWNDAFVSAIGSQNNLVDALANFALDQSFIGTDSEFMLANAGRELGRFTQYTGTAIQSNVKSRVKSIFSQYKMYGYGDSVWLGTADTSSYYTDCAEYGICGFQDELKSVVLSQSYTCSPTIRIISQDLTQTQQEAACGKMGYEEGYFHQRLETGNQPVADDNNIQLMVNIFNSSDDYGKYAGPIFDIDTNNGGMYLEGDPSKVGNIPNFVAYEANYANPDHYIWNLEHEYVHYLDGRFDLYGNFNSPTEEVVWWSEGVAEYVANVNDNPRAIETIKDGSVYTLREIFATNYDGFDQDRIYRWGYLAVRFMAERHMDDVNIMLAETRTGNWSGYMSIIDQWASLYQTEFAQWCQDLAKGNTPIDPPVDNKNPIAIITSPGSAKVGEMVTFDSAGSEDPDGQIKSYSWEFSDGFTSNEPMMQRSFDTAGEVMLRLIVTDDQGASTTINASLTIEKVDGSDGLPRDCAVRPKISGGQLVAGEPACLSSVDGLWLTIPAVNEHRSMSITTANGSGNLKVVYSNFGWPNANNLHGWSDNPGNQECITLGTQANYWGYVKITGNYDNAAIVVDFDAPGCRN